MPKSKLLNHLAFRYPTYRRAVCEFLRIDRYSQPAFAGMDKKLEAYLPQRGFYIEVGAHDGFTNSNTYYLDKIKGWKGLLVEPTPSVYRVCTKTRPTAKSFNCALTPFSYSANSIKLRYANTCTFVAESPDSELELERRLEQARTYTEPFEFEVPARTLSSILDELNISKIDFFSLDVEGYELEVLQGLDLKRHCPQYLLVECHTNQAKQTLEDYINPYYSYIAQLSERDYLYKAIDSR